jgi:hypothetical protein
MQRSVKGEVVSSTFDEPGNETRSGSWDGNWESKKISRA